MLQEWNLQCCNRSLQVFHQLRNVDVVNVVDVSHCYFFNSLYGNIIAISKQFKMVKLPAADNV